MYPSRCFRHRMWCWLLGRSSSTLAGALGRPCGMTAGTSTELQNAVLEHRFGGPFGAALQRIVELGQGQKPTLELRTCDPFHLFGKLARFERRRAGADRRII